MKGLNETPRRRYLIVIAALGAIALGCGENQELPASTHAVPGTPASVDEVPVLTVGSAAGDTLQELYRVITPFLTPDGRLVVPLASDRTIRVFASDGRFLTALGRPGEGPGEFGNIGGAWLRGDTIEAFDSQLRRITRFGPDGSVDVVNLDRNAPIQGIVPGAVADGWILVRVAGREEPESKEAELSRRDDIIVDHFGRHGAYLGEVARTLGMARFRSPVWNGFDPLSPRSVLQVGNGLLHVAETLTARIRMLEPDGTIRNEVTWTPEGVEAVAEVVASVIDSVVSEEPAEQADRTRARWEAAPAPEQLSVWWDYLVDPEGFIWVRPYEPFRHAAALGGFGTGSYVLGGNGQGGRWIVVSPEEGAVGEIELPAALNPVQITSDAVVSVERDTLGVESVHVYRLVRH